ncbi:MAG: hypothetical protein WCG23_13320 [bacterium]
MEAIQNNFPQNSCSLKQDQPANFERLKTQINKLDNLACEHKEVFTALSPIIPMRRISSIPDNIKDGNYTRAAGLLGLMAVNLPEDTRDLGSAWKQIKTGEFPSYYKDCQTPFSFFRGTALEPLVNKMGKLGVKLHQWDVPLYETKFGEFCKKTFKFDTFKYEGTKRFVPQVVFDESGKIITRDIEVFANKVEGKAFGKLVGNMLLRIPQISVFILSALEIPAIIKAFCKPEKSKDKAIDGCTQILKSGVNVSSILTGIGIFGALLKNRGPVGSIIGMGLGSVAGTYVSKKIGNNLDSVSDKLKIG